MNCNGQQENNCYFGCRYGPADLIDSNNFNKNQQYRKSPKHEDSKAENKLSHTRVGIPSQFQLGGHITDINQIYIIDCFIALSSVVEDRGQEFGFSS